MAGKVLDKLRTFITGQVSGQNGLNVILRSQSWPFNHYIDLMNAILRSKALKVRTLTVSTILTAS